MPLLARKTSAPPASEKVGKALAASIATAAALFPANALAQTAAHAAPAGPMTPSQQQIYQAKMDVFRARLLFSVPTAKLNQECKLKIVAMSDAVDTIEADGRFTRLLMNVAPDYLRKMADYANCTTKTAEELRKVGSDEEYYIFQLLKGSGAAPAIESIAVKGYLKPGRPAPGASAPPGKRAEAAIPKQ